MFETNDVIPLGGVDIGAVVTWIESIPFEAWPQQHPLRGELRPAMVNHPDWHDMGDRTLALMHACWSLLPFKRAIHWLEVNSVIGPIVESDDDADEIDEELGGRVRYRLENRMISVVMPGHGIDEHADAQVPGWMCRVHVPLTTNPYAILTIRGVEHCLSAGRAYAINVRAPHAIRNDGDVPRIHFMFDVMGVA